MKKILNTFLGIILTISLVLLISPKVHAMGLISGQVYKNVNGVRVGLSGIGIDYSSVNPSQDQQPDSGSVVSGNNGHWAMNQLDCGRGTYTFTPRAINNYGEFRPGSYVVDFGFGNDWSFTNRDFEWVLDMTLTVTSGCENNAPVNTINWNVNADLNEFRVWRNGGGTDGWIVQNLPANTRSYKDTNVTPGTTYTYFVWGQNSGVGGSQTWANEAVGISVMTDTNCNPPPEIGSLIIKQGTAGRGQEATPGGPTYGLSGLTSSEKGSNFYNDIYIQPVITNVNDQNNLMYVATSFVPRLVTYDFNTPLTTVFNNVDTFRSFLLLYAVCGNSSIPCTAGNFPLSPGKFYVYSPILNPNWQELNAFPLFKGNSEAGAEFSYDPNVNPYNTTTNTLNPAFYMFIYDTFPNNVWNTYNHIKYIENGQSVELNGARVPCENSGGC